MHHVGFQRFVCELAEAQFWKTALEFHDPVAAVAPGTWLEEAGRSP